MINLIFSIYRWVFARRIFKKWNTFLFHLSLRGLGILNFGNDRATGERFLIEKILPIIFNTDQPVCFDVGANVGKFSKLLLGRFPKASVHAFEPHPASFPFLVEDLALKNVTCQPIALGKIQGKSILYNRADDVGSSHASLYKEVISDIHGQAVISGEVDVDTIDSYTEKNKIDHIHLLKIDTEGNELDVLLGANDMLAQSRVDCIYFEFNQMNVVSRVFLNDFKKALSNYHFYRLLPNSLLPLNGSQITTELFGYQNILAVRIEVVRNSADEDKGIF